MAGITAAEFIAALEQSIEINPEFTLYRKFILKDMHSILDEINESSDDSRGNKLTIYDMLGRVSISTLRYHREYNTDGVLITKQWINKGNKIHSYKGKPGMIIYYPNGQIEVEEWYREDKLHRDGDKPAKIVYYQNGAIAGREWRQNGILTRTGDNPASRYYHDNGQIRSEEWWLNGKGGRANSKPSSIEYDKNGNIISQWTDQIV